MYKLQVKLYNLLVKNPKFQVKLNKLKVKIYKLLVKMYIILIKLTNYFKKSKVKCKFTSTSKNVQVPTKINKLLVKNPKLQL